ncbi:hypothetical protein AIOL_002127 [Candidatus Rhodobacter oscarellae]|uniref:Uncharacterized protein n=1 Tax=Candidatus Rhodobacter oscarellae TaxID=1675527 RepID=A0A0J9E2U2_9RHOB|nr:hypothetical protein AIOL_002127 [Candidatus Rhodobacter lobularis]
MGNNFGSVTRAFQSQFFCSEFWVSPEMPPQGRFRAASKRGG